MPLDKPVLIQVMTAYVKNSPGIAGSDHYYSVYSFLYWLLENGYLDYETEDMTMTALKPTAKGEEAGISKINCYYPDTLTVKPTLIYGTKAQQLLLDNLDEIAENEELYRQRHKEKRKAIVEKLKHERRKRSNTNSNTPWTDEEIRLLKSTPINNETVYRLAHKLKRSPTAIAFKAVLEGLVEKNELDLIGITDTNEWKELARKKGS